MSEPFKWRGGQVTRIEALTDAVFGFAITLLFVSFDVPQTFDSLLAQIAGFSSFAACFALISLVWYYHYRLFARFDMDDGWTIVLNCILLFVVLFYVYPLKFMFAIIFQFMTGSTAAFSNVETQLPMLMVIYGIGFIAVFAVFSLMYHHAIRQRERLRLTEDDLWYAYEHLATCVTMCAIGFLSIVIALSVPWQLSGILSGTTYGLIGPVVWLVHRKWVEPRRSRVTALAQTSS